MCPWIGYNDGTILERDGDRKAHPVVMFCPLQPLSHMLSRDGYRRVALLPSVDASSFPGSNLDDKRDAGWVLTLLSSSKASHWQRLSLLRGEDLSVFSAASICTHCGVETCPLVLQPDFRSSETSGCCMHQDLFSHLEGGKSPVGTIGWQIPVASFKAAAACFWQNEYALTPCKQCPWQGTLDILA